MLGALGAAAGPHLIEAFAFRDARRRAASIGALGVAAGLAYCMVLVDPDTTFLGMPTSSTLTSFAHELAEAPEVLRSAVVPVAPRGAALLLALLAIWASSSTAAWVGRSPERTLASVSPSIVIFVAVMALGSGAYAAITVAYAAAVACYLLSRSIEELAGSHSWFSGRGRLRRLAAAGAAAGALAVMLGAALGPALPGATSAALLDYRALGARQGVGTWKTVSPLVDIRGRLVEEPAEELFTVRTDRRAYWRLVALDEFDGSAWVLSEKEAPPAGDGLPPDDSGAVAYQSVHQHFEIGPLASRWLPAAYRPTEIGLADAYVIEEVLGLVAPEDLSDGIEYDVVSQVPTPTAADLAQTRFVEHGVWSRYLALPSRFPARVVELAQDIVDGAAADTPYRRAMALQDWLRDPARFTYTLDAPDVHTSTSIETFLLGTRRGYCEQFAGSFAAMARAVGLPARVAVGFTPGTFDPEAGVYRVTTKDAHAWPEVYLAGIGWTAFEPTPGRYEPTPGDPTGTQAERRASSPSATAATDGPVTTAVPGATPPKNPDRPRTPNKQPDAARRSGGAPWALLGAAAVAAFALGLLLLHASVTAIIVTRRSLLRRHAPTNRQKVTGAWDEAIDRLAEAGIERRPSATPIEFALRHAPARGAGEAGPPLMDLARLHTAAVFSPHEPGDDDAAAAWEQVARLGAALRASTRTGLRWRRRLDPRRLRGARP